MNYRITYEFLNEYGEWVETDNDAGNNMDDAKYVFADMQQRTNIRGVKIWKDPTGCGIELVPLGKTTIEEAYANITIQN